MIAWIWAMQRALRKTELCLSVPTKYKLHQAPGVSKGCFSLFQFCGRFALKKSLVLILVGSAVAGTIHSSSEDNASSWLVPQTFKNKLRDPAAKERRQCCKSSSLVLLSFSHTGILQEDWLMPSKTSVKLMIKHSLFLTKPGFLFSVSI